MGCPEALGLQPKWSLSLLGICCLCGRCLSPMGSAGLRISLESLIPDSETTVKPSPTSGTCTIYNTSWLPPFKGCLGQGACHSRSCFMSLESMIRDKLDFATGLTFGEPSKVSPEGLGRRMFFSTVTTSFWYKNMTNIYPWLMHHGSLGVPVS